MRLILYTFLLDTCSYMYIVLRISIELRVRVPYNYTVYEYTILVVVISMSSPPLSQSTLNAWCLPLLHRCEDYLSTLVRQHRDTPTGASTNLSDESEQEAIRYLFTLGEVAHVSLSALVPLHNIRTVHCYYNYRIYM